MCSATIDLKTQCTALHCTAPLGTTLQCTALYCTALQWSELESDELTVGSNWPGGPLYCTLPPYTIHHCTVLNCTSMFNTWLHCTVPTCTIHHCTVLLHVQIKDTTALHLLIKYIAAMYCTALQIQYALYCNAPLQYFTTVILREQQNNAPFNLVVCSSYNWKRG